MNNILIFILKNLVNFTKVHSFLSFFHKFKIYLKKYILVVKGHEMKIYLDTCCYNYHLMIIL